VPDAFAGTMLVTVHPESVAPAALAAVEVLIAIGGDPGRTFHGFGEGLATQVPAVHGPLAPGEALVWFRECGGEPVRFRPEMASIERRRHRRKYAEGELGPDRSFYFRGPDGRLKLRAMNLTLFIQLAEGVDDETWLYHLRRSDYSRWLRGALKDDALADEVERVEQEPGRSAAESREAVRRAIEGRYTAAP
jgi:hypothetical protein